MEQTIREMLFEDFGIDLPIRGGHGNSVENAVIMEYVEPNNFVGAEYTYLKLLGIGRGINWRPVGQELFHEGERVYDKIKMEIQRMEGDEPVTSIENYYFDITECFGK